MVVVGQQLAPRGDVFEHAQPKHQALVTRPAGVVAHIACAGGCAIGVPRLVDEIGEGAMAESALA